MRAVIYARYSSESQRRISIEDQMRICREFVTHHGWRLVRVFADRGVTGADYQAMRGAANKREFDVVVTESIDRLSRDQEDIAGLFKRFRFDEVKIHTLADGEISEIHVGLKGTMSALFLRDLADKAHRDLRGRVPVIA